MTPSLTLFDLAEELILDVGKYLYDRSLLAFAMTSKHAHKITAPLLEDEKNQIVRVWDQTEEGVAFLKFVRVSRDKLPKFWSKYNALLQACEEENIEKVKALLEDKRVLHVLNDEKLPEVHEEMYGLLEAAWGSIEIVELLYNAETDYEFEYLDFGEQLLLVTGEDSILDLKEEETLWDTLHYALMFRSPPEVIDLLISSGLSLHSLYIVGFGPLQCAFGFVRYDDYETEQKELEYLRWLLCKPELRGLVDARGRSAVHYAVFKNHVAGLKMLLTELGADVDALGNDGLHLCLQPLGIKFVARGLETHGYQVARLK
ncbi:hypothetical protein BJX65DRAFT_307238 [Aspergillus insuetus]